MKKPFLFAALLLSSAAQAETWVCEAEGATGLTTSGELMEYSDYSSFIVDSDQGWKSVGYENDYVGDCTFAPFTESGTQSLKCYSEANLRQTTLTITLDIEAFTWIAVYPTSLIVAQSGMCTKI